jgi:hypothetical protein
MGGESRPWALAYGPAGSEPKIASVVDGRRREDVQEMMEDFAEDLLEHFRAEGFSFDPIQKDDFPIEEPPQLWVPGPSHIDMIHYLSYAYWKRRAEDNIESPTHALSRLCGWLFREFSSTGQQTLVDAATALRAAYVFPADDFSLSHLGVQRVWLSNHGDYESKLLKAREAAKVSLGITMAPEVEVQLQTLLDDFYENQKLKKDTQRFADAISAILAEEVTRRWKMTSDAIDTLKADSREENKGLPVLVQDSLSRFFYDFQRLERQLADPERGPSFTPHPETDHHGSAAASAYYLKVAADSKYLPTLVHDDSELLRESLADGHSVKGIVTDVQVSANGNYKEIYWMLRTEASDDFRMRSGEYLSPLGNPKHQVKTLSVEFVSETEVEIFLEWRARKTIALDGEIPKKPEDPNWEGQTLVFVPFDNSQFDFKASRAVWDSRDGSGSWLTHSKAQRFPDEKVVDDVVQIEGLAK